MPAFIMANLGSVLKWGAVGVAAAGAACVAYGVVVEHQWYRATRWRVAILPSGAEPLALLHLSDLHFTRRDRRKKAFLSTLDRPDVAVITGDFLAEPAGVEMAVEAVRPLRGRVASFVVLGSNDYFIPRMINPLDYVIRSRPRTKAKGNRWRDLVTLLEADGWTFLRNQKTGFGQNGTRFEVIGLDDPHIAWQDLRTAVRERPDEVGLAVVHSPDPAPELAALGYRLILAGHTHGGQVRMPFVGALLTNGTTPTKLAMGLSRLGPAFLHVSPGLGTSKYAPFRFLCRPEATYIDLLPATAAG